MERGIIVIITMIIIIIGKVGEHEKNASHFCCGGCTLLCGKKGKWIDRRGIK